MFVISTVDGAPIVECRMGVPPVASSYLAGNGARFVWSLASGASEAFVDLRFSRAYPRKYLARDLRLRVPEVGQIVDATTGGFLAAALPDDVWLGISVRGMAIGRWIEDDVFRIFAHHAAATPVPHCDLQDIYVSREAKLSFAWALRSSSRQGWSVPHRFRHGQVAAFCITDHADFDVPAAYRTIIGHAGAGGFAAHRLKLSKTVFAKRGPGTTQTQATLEDPVWRSLIREWQVDGRIEVGLHLTRPLATSRRDAIGDLDAIQELRPVFWIDHGVDIPQAVWLLGGTPASEYFIWDELLQRGVSVFWNRRDLLDNAPRGALDLLSTRETLLKPELARVLTLRGVAEPAAWKAFVNRCFDPAIARGARRVLQGISRRDFSRTMSGLKELGTGGATSVAKGLHVFTPTDAERYLLPVYAGLSLRGVSAARPLFFSSQLIREPVQCWSTPNVEQLIARRGIHIAHTYLGAPKRFPLVTGDGLDTRISAAFESVLEGLGAAVRGGDLWAPGITELADSLLAVFRTEVAFHERLDTVAVPAESSGQELTCMLLGTGSPSIGAPHERLHKGGLELVRFPAGSQGNARIAWTDEPSGLGAVRVTDSRGAAIVGVIHAK